MAEPRIQKGQFCSAADMDQGASFTRCISRNAHNQAVADSWRARFAAATGSLLPVRNCLYK
eukprot:scaffold215931_cov17-Tisochrysis_lutea.AAC.1